MALTGNLISDALLRTPDDLWSQAIIFSAVSPELRLLGMEINAFISHGALWLLPAHNLQNDSAKVKRF